MFDIQNVLFPVDLSENAEKLVDFAQAITEKLGARLHVVFVVEDVRYFAGFYVPHPSLSTLERELEKGSKEKLREFCDEYLYEKVAHYEVLVGDPAEEIVQYAADQHMDLIVMGSHGRKGLDRLLFGSVADKVVKHAPVPVLIVNPYTHRI